MAKVKMTVAQSNIIDLLHHGIRDPRQNDELDLVRVKIMEYSLEKATKDINVSRTVLRDGHSGEDGRMDWRTELWRINQEGKVTRL